MRLAAGVGRLADRGTTVALPEWVFTHDRSERNHAGTRTTSGFAGRAHGTLERQDAGRDPGCDAVARAAARGGRRRRARLGRRAPLRAQRAAPRPEPGRARLRSPRPGAVRALDAAREPATRVRGPGRRGGPAGGG